MLKEFNLISRINSMLMNTFLCLFNLLPSTDDKNIRVVIQEITWYKIPS